MGDINISQFLPSFLGATLIALVHLLTPRFRFMHTQDNLWVPTSAGVALAYVFVDIFPHLARVQAKLADTEQSTLYGFLTHNIYLVGLAGFAVYLGIILLEITYRNGQKAVDIGFKSAPGSVKIECASLLAYNFLIGYLLSEQITHRPEPVILFGIAMAIHIAGINHVFQDHFPVIFVHTMRFALAAGVYAGWTAGVAIEVSDGTLALWYSSLAGGLIVVATVYELPQVRSPRQYGAFLIGMGAFSALVLVIDFFGH